MRNHLPPLSFNLLGVLGSLGGARLCSRLGIHRQRAVLIYLKSSSLVSGSTSHRYWSNIIKSA